MGKSVLLGVALAAVLVLASCAIVVSPAMGTIYTEVKAPLTATQHPTYSRIGKAECTSILGLIAQGDASIEAAAKAGGITKIHHVDYEAKNILGIYGKFTTVVYGD
jgi:hypothetical protein